MKKFKTDVLIVGSGASGLKAGITIKERNKDINVIIVSKGKAGKSGTTANAISDRMAFHATLEYTPPVKNNWKYHADDIFKIGRYSSDYPLAEILARESEEALDYLDKIGVPFVKKNGKFVQFLTDGSIYPRACYTGPFTAIDIEEKLFEKAKELKIIFFENCNIFEIIVKNKKVKGAAGCNRNGEIFIFQTEFIILATGGGGSIYKDNCYPAKMTGDGYSLALKSGAELVNMEFIQIGTCIKKLKIACSGSFMRAIPKIVDKEGKEILFDKFRAEKVFKIIFRKGASWPVSNEEETKIIDILNYRENGLFLDYTENSYFWGSKNVHKDILLWYKEKGVKNPIKLLPWERFKLINPEMYKYLKKKGIDLSKEKIEIFEAVQHFQGGVKIGIWADTAIKGLFACGECAGGQHGANRPGGNALLDTQVFGKRCGVKISSLIQKKSKNKENIKIYKRDFKGKIPENDLKKIQKFIKESMSKYVSVERREKNLKKLFDEFTEIYKKIKKEKGKNPWTYFETESMLLTSLAVIKSCLLRKESRGPHLMWENSKILPSDKKFDGKYVCVNLEIDKIKGKLKKVKRS